MGNCFADDPQEETLPKLKLNIMGNSIKPHIDRAEKTGTCNLAKQGLDEVNKLLHCQCQVKTTISNGPGRYVTT